MYKLPIPLTLDEASQTSAKRESGCGGLQPSHGLLVIGVCGGLRGPGLHVGSVKFIPRKTFSVTGFIIITQRCVPIPRWWLGSPCQHLGFCLFFCPSLPPSFPVFLSTLSWGYIETDSGGLGYIRVERNCTSRGAPGGSCGPHSSPASLLHTAASGPGRKQGLKWQSSSSSVVPAPRLLCAARQ